MIKIEAAHRLSATYEGTKSKDLLAYVKALEPSITVHKPGPGGKVKRPSYLSGYTKPEVAASLAQKLVNDGWKGTKLKNKETGTPYIIYRPAVDPAVAFTPYICLYKPTATTCRVIIEHMTAAALRESAFLRKLNRGN